MGGIIFILIQTAVLLILAGCTTAGAATVTPNESAFNISLTELIAVFSFIGGLFGVWIDVRLRIKSLEIKTKQNTDSIKDNKSENTADICSIEKIIKENATNTQAELKEVTNKINDLHLMFVERFGTIKK